MPRCLVVRTSREARSRPWPKRLRAPRDRAAQPVRQRPDLGLCGIDAERSCQVGKYWATHRLRSIRGVKRGHPLRPIVASYCLSDGEQHCKRAVALVQELWTRPRWSWSAWGEPHSSCPNNQWSAIRIFHREGGRLSRQHNKIKDKSRQPPVETLQHDLGS